MHRRVVRPLAAIAVVTALLLGCGSSDKGHNNADVAFAQDMTPHHEQAVDMAKSARRQASNARVKALAKRIEAAQGPEIATMEGWLKGWGVKADRAKEHSGGMHMGNGGSGSGMMTAADMAKLDKARGPAFDRLFLTLMITHHSGALTMARTELEKGKDGDAKKLARDISDSQRAEIDEMRGLLERLPPA